jgi:hypothetical protein
MMGEISKEIGDAGMGLEVRFLEPEEYGKIAHLFTEEQAAMPDPQFSKVLVALDGEHVVGIMVAQMALHVEPIIIEKDYRGTGVWKEMAEMLDGYLSGTGIAGAYAQPVHPSTKHMTEQMGFVEMENALWLKVYDPELKKYFPEGKN